MSTLSENMGLVRKVTNKVWGRLSMFSSDIEYFDLEQEACKAYINAEDKFSNKSGVKFSTYAFDAILNRLNFIADTAIQQSKFEQKIDFGEDNEGPFESYLESISSVSDPIEIALMTQDLYDEAASNLTPIASVLFRETFAPSDKIVEEFRLKERELKAQGKARAGYFYLNTVADFLVRSGLSDKAVSKAKKEIIELGKTR